MSIVVASTVLVVRSRRKVDYPVGGAVAMGSWVDLIRSAERVKHSDGLNKFARSGKGLEIPTTFRSR